MLAILAAVVLGQTCTPTSCSRAPSVSYAPAPVQAVQEPRQAYYATPACSVQNVSVKRRKGQFRPFSGRRGGCR